jgi:hypothetical protein
VSPSNRQCNAQSPLLRLEPYDDDALAMRHSVTRSRPSSAHPRSEIYSQTLNGDLDWTPDEEVKGASSDVCSDSNPWERGCHGDNHRFDARDQVRGRDKAVVGYIDGDGIGRKTFYIDSPCPPRVHSCYKEDGCNVITDVGAAQGKAVSHTNEWTDCIPVTDSTALPSDRSEFMDLTGLPVSQSHNRSSPGPRYAIVDESGESPEFNACFSRSLNIMNYSSLDIMTHVSGYDDIDDEATMIEHEAFQGELWVRIKAETNHETETSTDKSRENKYNKYRSLLGEKTKRSSPKADKYRATKPPERPRQLSASKVASPEEHPITLNDINNQDIHEKLDERLENLRAMNDIHLLQRELDRFKESTKTTASPGGTLLGTRSKYEGSTN